MKNIRGILLAGAFLATFTVLAQEKEAKSATISFFSEQKDLKSENDNISSTLNTETGEISFDVIVDGFQIKNGMQKNHFLADDVMDAENYPGAKFVGKIDNLEEVNWEEDGTYEVTVTGEMTIKDKTEPMTAEGTIEVKGKKIIAKSTFDLDRFVFGVEGKKMISQVLEIDVEAAY